MPYALITAGSKGIGYAIAEALAKRKYDLVLVARHEETLEVARQKLQQNYAVKVFTIPCDLSKEDSAETVTAYCLKNNILLNILCNVAGIGGSADYLANTLQDMQFMIRLNIGSVTSLTMQLLPILQKNTPAFILNVSSMAAFAPIPSKNVYSATKSAVLYFSYSLHYQLKKQQISVSVLCPGPVFTTAAIEKVTIKQLGRLGRMMAVSPAVVGEVAVKRLLNKKMIIIPGLFAKALSMIIRILPRRLVTYIYYKMGYKQ